VCTSSVYICFDGWCIFNHMVNVHASAYLVVLGIFVCFLQVFSLTFFVCIFPLSFCCYFDL
jgi:hypothetical protein